MRYRHKKGLFSSIEYAGRTVQVHIVDPYSREVEEMRWFSLCDVIRHIMGETIDGMY
ncbi:4399_t:CDS:2 [Funneliformis geosporum]|nr:4399_t:CDS:2 [Funneliformis geosporum]